MPLFNRQPQQRPAVPADPRTDDEKLADLDRRIHDAYRNGAMDMADHLLDRRIQLQQPARGAS